MLNRKCYDCKMFEPSGIDGMRCMKDHLGKKLPFEKRLPLPKYKVCEHWKKSKLY